LNGYFCRYIDIFVTISTNPLRRALFFDRFQANFLSRFELDPNRNIHGQLLNK